MNINIVARKTVAKDSFRDRVEKKLAKFDKFFDDDANAVVTVTNERDRETVEITIRSRGMYFRSEQTTSDRFDSLEAVTDSLTRQIVKNKSKLEKKFKAAPVDFSTFDAADYAEDSYDIVKVKRFPIKPMTVEEAILQMNMLGHTFFMFRNGTTNEINLVYKRKNGDYAVIEPEEDDYE